MATASVASAPAPAHQALMDAAAAPTPLLRRARRCRIRHRRAWPGANALARTVPRACVGRGAAKGRLEALERRLRPEVPG